MFSIEDLLADVPPWRDDEPSSLRQDIVDELSDHLSCAFHRELLKSGDSETAKTRVMERFGDPRRIARQLWFQAMWSRIMSQRVVLASSITTAAASLMAVGFVSWLLLQQQQQSAEQQLALMTVVERMSQALERREPAESDAAIAPVRDRVPLKIQLVDVAKPNSPVSEYSVNVSTEPMKTGDVTLSEVTGTDGQADFAYVQIGRYRYTIHTPWGETATAKFTVHPALEHLEVIQVPAAPPVMGRLQIATELPQSLRERDVSLLVLLRMKPRTIGELEWSPVSWSNVANQPTMTPNIMVAMLPDGRHLTAILPLNHPLMAGSFSGGFLNGGLGGGGFSGGGFGGGGFGGGGGGFFSLPAESVPRLLGSALVGQFDPGSPEALMWADSATVDLTSGDYSIHWLSYLKRDLSDGISLEDSLASVVANLQVAQSESGRFTVLPGAEARLVLVPPPQVIAHVIAEIDAAPSDAIQGLLPAMGAGAAATPVP